MSQRDDLQIAQRVQCAGFVCLTRLGVVGGVGEAQDAQRPLVQGAELQGLEHARQAGAVGTREAQVGAGFDSEVQVGEQAVEAAVAHDVVEVIAQRLSSFALDLVRVSDDAVEPVIEVEPLGGGLGAHARNPGQVVTGLADQGGQVRVALGRHPVALLHLLRRHAPQCRHALDRVEHGAPLGDRLEGVAVPRADENLHALGLGGGRQGGQDVVGLVARSGERCDAHGLQDLLDELDLPEEGLRCLVAGSLVLGVLLGAEGASRQVEGDGHVGGPLAVQQRQEHGDEAVDGVGGLTGRRGEVVDGQGVEGTEGH